MSELTSQQVAAWLRQKAKRFNEMADEIDAESSPPRRRSGGNNIIQSVTPRFERDGHPTEPPSAAAVLEHAVKEKTGRIGDLAERLGWDSAIIEAILEKPDTRVYAGERGWLKIKE